MKKLKTLLVITLVSMVSFVGAQTPSLSVKGGLNMSNIIGDKISDKSMKTGFHIGIGADFDFAPNMAIQSGLFFTSKGAKYTEDFLNSELKVNANYLQIPVHFAYKIDVMPETRIVLHAGPYIAYGVGGKINFRNSLTDEIKDRFDINKSKLNTFDTVLNNFDAGLGLGVGAEFGAILVDIGWDMGLVNNSKYEGKYGENIKTQNAYITLGYKF